MEAYFNYEYRKEDLEGMPLEELALFALAFEGRAENTEVSVTFVTDEEIAELNETYRGKEGPTDVLSFECDGIDTPGFDEAVAEDEAFELGDIVIAPDIAEAQAKDFGTTFEQEISLLLVHGMLHLCGYDHMEEDEAVIMEAREDEILRAWEAR